MNIHIRRCVQCGAFYDIGTNYEICSECRLNIKRLENERRNLQDQKEYI